MLNAFKMADEVLLQGVQGITDLITTPGLINTDFADVKMILTNAGSALMGVGYASGDGRAVAAARAAISSPLLEASIEGARGILLNVSGPSDLGLFELNEAAEIIGAGRAPRRQHHLRCGHRRRARRRGAHHRDRGRLRPLRRRAARRPRARRRARSVSTTRTRSPAKTRSTSATTTSTSPSSCAEPTVAVVGAALLGRPGSGAPIARAVSRRRRTTRQRRRSRRRRPRRRRARTGRASRPRPGCAEPTRLGVAPPGARRRGARRDRADRRRPARGRRRVTAARGLPLAVVTADCAPVVLACDDAVGVVHAGHRGLAARRDRGRGRARCATIGHGPSARVPRPVHPPRALRVRRRRPRAPRRAVRTRGRRPHARRAHRRSTSRPRCASRSSVPASTTFDDCGVCTADVGRPLLVPARRHDRPAGHDRGAPERR